MTYKDSKEEPRAGDKVVGPGVKGVVAEVRDGAVVVVGKGPWDPRGAATEARTECDPATLTLHSRAPAKPKVGAMDRIKALIGR